MKILVSLQPYLMNQVIFLISGSGSINLPYQLLYMVVDHVWVPLKTSVFHPKETLRLLGDGNDVFM